MAEQVKAAQTEMRDQGLELVEKKVHGERRVGPFGARCRVAAPGLVVEHERAVAAEKVE